jgi:hypothetical protein
LAIIALLTGRTVTTLVSSPFMIAVLDAKPR